MSSDRFTEHYRLLSADPVMRAKLLADPKAALAEYFGAILDGDYRIEVIEQRPDTITAVLPTPPEAGTDPAGLINSAPASCAYFATCRPTSPGPRSPGNCRSR